MNKCIGCGIKLQNKFKERIGYTPKLENKYCERCFKTINYNEFIKVQNLDNFSIIDKINKLGHYTIFITDLLSLNRKTIEVFKRINNQKALVINKCDMIPSNFKLEHLEENIKNSYEISCDVIFISAKKKMYLNKIIDIIKENTKVIICGETSSGKSTLINNLTGSNLTTSKYENTTLDFIKLPYLDYIIYDTPGIIITKRKDSDKILVYTKKLSNDYILNIEGIKFQGSGNITCIVSDRVKITSKKEKIKLEEISKIDNNRDLELVNGFIYVKDSLVLSSSQKLNVRKSIIGR